MTLRYFTAAIAAVLLIGACTPAAPESALTIEDNSLTVPAYGGTFRINFKTPDSWTATLSDQSWCQIAPSSGEAGSHTLSIAADINETALERHTVISISSGVQTGTIEVLQVEANSLIVLNKTLEVPAEGGSYEVEVQHNIDYSARVEESAAGWLFIATTPVPESKVLTSDKVKIEVQPNISGWPREGLVLLTSSLGDERVKVSQKGADVFSLSATETQVPAQGGEFTVMVSGSVPYHINSMPDWVKETGLEGRAHTFSVEMNTDEEPRVGVLVFCDEGGVCLPFMVNQEGYPKWASASFRHQSLLMRFTATWCGWCPRMNKSVHQAQEDFPGKIQHLAIHGGGSSIIFDGADALMSQYKISGFPTGICDGRIEIYNEAIKTTARNIVNASKETESTYGTACGARIATTLKGYNLDIDMRLFFKAPGAYKVSVFLVEDGIKAAQSDYEEGDHSSYTHDNIARQVLTPVLGEAFNQEGGFSTRDFKWSVKLNEKWSVPNVRVLAYVQAAYGDRKKIASANFGDYYVDNCFTVKAGKTLELETE